ncbi:MAG: type II secretion system F family protein [Geminicoccaceae bacterium]|jgi:tight adherence protein B|nr:type II secretion system F family protein [Geminicoccaceae bacterium]MCB9968173.1 type II secretion system F family protein [Geminicoccaceae bacterium]HRY23105.1 type II secretion system F family protein [Geminicoccaceae bacterium]
MSISADLLLPGVIGFSTLLVAWAASEAVAGGGKARSGERIARALQQSRSTGRPREADAAGVSVRRGGTPRQFERWVGEALSGITSLSALSGFLLRAGIGASPTSCLITLLGICVVLAGIALLLGQSLLVSVVVLPTGALLLSRFYLARRVASRERQFLALFPEAIDLIVRGVRAGLPVTEALRTVGEDVRDPVGQIFREIASGIKIGMTLEDALASVARMMPVAEFKFFAISLAVQQETGGNLAEILSNLSNMMRRRDQVKLKIKAMSSEARASAMIISALPIVVGLIIFYVNPEYLEVLFYDSRGQMLLGSAVFSMLFGSFVISRMIRFDI